METNAYMRRIREIAAKVNMGFYKNSAEDVGDVIVNRHGWSMDANGDAHLTGEDFMFQYRKQALTYGIETARYATLDGNSYLAGSDGQVAKGRPVLLAGTSSSTNIGLWSDVLADENGSFPPSRLPAVTICYSGMRTLNKILVKGNAAWEQCPVEYDIVVYGKVSGANSYLRAGRPLTPAALHSDGETAVPGVVGREGEEDIVTFSITGGRTVEQTISFLYGEGQTDVTFRKMKIVIKKWSQAGAAAKLMYFSRDRVMNFTSGEIRSIDVYEEKCASASELSYGPLAASCTVYVRDGNERFTAHPELLRKGKLVEPFVAVRGQEYMPLGKFYSDSWDMEAQSNYVKCKAYDILYSLQNLELEFPLEADSRGRYAVPQGWTLSRVLELVRQKINLAKTDMGAYGADVSFDVDPCLADQIVPYLLLENKSAWDVLQDIASFSLCNIYTKRSGEIRFSYDMCTCPRQSVPNAAITPSNAFTHQLPLQSKMVINRVRMPYYALRPGKTEDNKIELRREEATVDGDRLVFTVKLKNFYPVIENLEVRNKDGKIETPHVQKLFFDSVIFDITASNLQDVYLQINAESYFSLETQEKISSGSVLSQKENGVCEYENKQTPLLIGEEFAATKGDLILAKYAEGVDYSETDWIGTPQLMIDTVIPVSTKGKTADYVCLANEFKLDGGLRAKSKLRKV